MTALAESMIKAPDINYEQRSAADKDRNNSRATVLSHMGLTKLLNMNETGSIGAEQQTMETELGYMAKRHN